MGHRAGVDAVAKIKFMCLKGFQFRSSDAWTVKLWPHTARLNPLKPQQVNRHIMLNNSAYVEIPSKYHLLNFLQQEFQRALLLTLLSFQRVWKPLSLSLSTSVRANFPAHIRDQRQTCLISISSFLPS